MYHPMLTCEHWAVEFQSIDSINLRVLMAIGLTVYEVFTMCVPYTIHKIHFNELISTVLGTAHFKAHFLKSPHYQIKILNICDLTVCQILNCT